MCSQDPIMVRDISCQFNTFGSCTMDVGTYTTCSDGSTDVVSIECNYAACANVESDCIDGNQIKITRRQNPYNSCDYRECTDLDAVDVSTTQNMMFEGFWIHPATEALMYDTGAVCGNGFQTEYASAICQGLGYADVEMWEREQTLGTNGYYSVSDMFCSL